MHWSYRTLSKENVIGRNVVERFHCTIHVFYFDIFHEFFSRMFPRLMLACQIHTQSCTKNDKTVFKNLKSRKNYNI